MPDKAMQESYPQSEGNPVSPSPDEVPLFRPYDPDLIGPRDASDSARGLLRRRAEDVGSIALIHSAAFDHEYARFVCDVTTAMNDGNLRLSDTYPDMSSQEQIAHFVTNLLENDNSASQGEVLDSILEVISIAPAARQEVQKVTAERKLTWTDKVRHIVPLVSRRALESFGITLSRSFDPSGIER